MNLCTLKPWLRQILFDLRMTWLDPNMSHQWCSRFPVAVTFQCFSRFVKIHVPQLLNLHLPKKGWFSPKEKLYFPTLTFLDWCSNFVNSVSSLSCAFCCFYCSFLDRSSQTWIPPDQCLELGPGVPQASCFEPFSLSFSVSYPVMFMLLCSIGFIPS